MYTLEEEREDNKEEEQERKADEDFREIEQDFIIEEKINIPQEKCSNEQHFTDILLFGICHSCKRNLISTYDY